MQYLDTVAAAQIDELSVQFYPANNQIPARYDIDRYQLIFQTVDENDQPVVVRAELFFPRLTAWSAFPVLVYGAGTTGIGANCAPLDEWTHGRNWGNYRTHMLSYAAQGMIAILPLWQGYDDTARTHPYFVARLEGYLLLDAARAVYNFFASPAPGVLAQPLDAVFFGGYSQGGHGAFAADQFASWYAPELTVKGVIGHATAPSVEALLRERPPLAPYIVHAYSSYYGPYVIAPESVFLPQWLPTFAQDVTSKCVDEVYQYYPVEPDRLYRPEFLNALYGGQLENGFAAFKQVLDLNYAGSAINPDTPAVWRRRAIARMMTGQTSEAIIAAKEHLTANPGDTGMSALLGAAQILSKDYDGADQTLAAGLQIAPNQRDLVQNLSELRRLQKRPADAAVLIDGFLAQNPTDGLFQFKRAMADVAGDLSQQRRKEINDAIAGGNATAGIYVVAAAIDFRDGKPDAARQKLEEANKRATAQDMRTMLEDEFFRDHIQFNAAGQAPATGAPAPAAVPAQGTDD